MKQRLVKNSQYRHITPAQTRLIFKVPVAIKRVREFSAVLFVTATKDIAKCA
jgi:hypothetical protein